MAGSGEGAAIRPGDVVWAPAPRSTKWPATVVEPDDAPTDAKRAFDKSNQKNKMLVRYMPLSAPSYGVIPLQQLVPWGAPSQSQLEAAFSTKKGGGEQAGEAIADANTESVMRASELARIASEPPRSTEAAPSRSVLTMLSPPAKPALKLKLRVTEPTPHVAGKKRTRAEPKTAADTAPAAGAGAGTDDAGLDAPTAIAAAVDSMEVDSTPLPPPPPVRDIYNIGLAPGGGDSSSSESEGAVAESRSERRKSSVKAARPSVTAHHHARPPSASSKVASSSSKAKAKVARIPREDEVSSISGDSESSEDMRSSSRHRKSSSSGSKVLKHKSRPSSSSKARGGDEAPPSKHTHSHRSKEKESEGAGESEGEGKEARRAAKRLRRSELEGAEPSRREKVREGSSRLSERAAADGAFDALFSNPEGEDAPSTRAVAVEDPVKVASDLYEAFDAALKGKQRDAIHDVLQKLQAITVSFDLLKRVKLTDLLKGCSALREGDLEAPPPPPTGDGLEAAVPVVSTGVAAPVSVASLADASRKLLSKWRAVCTQGAIATITTSSGSGKKGEGATARPPPASAQPAAALPPLGKERVGGGTLDSTVRGAPAPVPSSSSTNVATTVGGGGTVGVKGVDSASERTLRDMSVKMPEDEVRATAVKLFGLQWQEALQAQVHSAGAGLTAATTSTYKGAVKRLLTCVANAMEARCNDAAAGEGEYARAVRSHLLWLSDAEDIRRGNVSGNLTSSGFAMRRVHTLPTAVTAYSKLHACLADATSALRRCVVAAEASKVGGEEKESGVLPGERAVAKSVVGPLSEWLALRRS